MDLAEEKLAVIHENNQTFLAEIAAIKVTNTESQAKASEILAQIKKRYNRMEAIRKEMVMPMKEAVKKIDNMFKIEEEPLLKAEAMIKGLLRQFYVVEERKAQEEVRRKQAEYDEQQRKAREEAARIEAERKAKEAEAEAARKAAEEAKSAAQRKKLEAEAKLKEAEAAKLEEKAEAVVEEALLDVPVVEAPAVNTRTGSGLTSYKKVWKWKVENEDLLRKLRPELFILDEKAVNKLVQSGERKVAGLFIYEDVAVAQKS